MSWAGLCLTLCCSHNIVTTDDSLAASSAFRPAVKLLCKASQSSMHLGFAQQHAVQ